MNFNFETMKRNNFEPVIVVAALMAVMSVVLLIIEDGSNVLKRVNIMILWCCVGGTAYLAGRYKRQGEYWKDVAERLSDILSQKDHSIQSYEKALCERDVTYAKLEKDFKNQIEDLQKQVRRAEYAARASERDAEQAEQRWSKACGRLGAMTSKYNRLLKQLQEGEEQDNADEATEG